MTDKTFEVPDVHCGHCVSSIEGAVGKLAGIDAVDVDLDTHTVAVRYDETELTTEAIVEAIEDQGYAVAG